jgi:hypothetical protein
MLATGKYSGELSYFSYNLTYVELIALYAVSALGFAFTYIFFRNTKNKRVKIKQRQLIVSSEKLNIFFFLLVIINIIFFIETSVGLVGGESESKYSTVFAVLRVEVVFMLFYPFCRKSKKMRFLFWASVILYSVLSLMKGWSGFLLLIVFFELHFFFKDRKINLRKQLVIITIIPLFVFIVGGIAYQKVYPYKMDVRGFMVPEPKLYEAVDKLVSRLSFFPISVGTYEKHNEMERLYHEDGVAFKELKGSLRQLVPRFIMKEKDFRSLNNNSKQAVMPSLSASTSNNFGFVMYGITLFSISFLEGSLWLMITGAMVFATKATFDLLEQYPGQLDILYFFMLAGVYNNASLETAFGNSYGYLVFIIPVLFILGIIKVRRQISNEASS